MPGGGGTGWQVPCVEPRGTLQTSPLQQSELFVHVPFVCWHIVPHTSVPLGPGMHGAPLQQSPLKAQAWPAIAHMPSAMHRGMPSLSSWQAPELPGAPQQSLRVDEMLHM